jgi:hypothetical protein
MGIDLSRAPETFRAKILGRPSPFAQSEADHQNRFVGVLKARGLPYVWHNTKKRSTGTLGAPDVIVAVDGAVYWIEFKLPGEELSPAQVAFAHLLALQGCKMHVVSSAEEALSLLAETK